MAEQTPVQLVDSATGSLVGATLRRPVAVADLERVEAAWRPARLAAVEVIEALGRHAEHRHWNWTAKAPLVAAGDHDGLMIEYLGEPQGVLLYATAPGTMRGGPDTGFPLLYVEFLEVAPWNTRSLAEQPRLRAVGSNLMYGAVAVSRERGRAGRIGLHALPQAEAFYERIGMTRFRGDREHEGLTYFELTAEAAARLVPEG